jgi:ATP-dependent exoDNAse (exonuclease V) beta subunit
VTIKKELSKTSFAFDYFEEQLMSRMDALNLLYVALTRAREAIYVLAPAPTENKSANNTLTTIGDLLWQSIQDHPELQALFSEHQYWLDGAIHPPTEKATTLQTLAIEPSVSISALIKAWQEPGELDLSSTLARSDQQKIGELAHLVLARMQHEHQLDQVIRQLELQGWLPAHLKEAVSALASTALQHPQLAEWFNGNYQSISEKAILLQGGSIRRPDKVLVGEQETILLDFKFTQEASTAHRRQLSEYQQLLQQMGYPAVKAFIYYGFSQQLVALAQLPAGQGNLFQQ